MSDKNFTDFVIGNDVRSAGRWLRLFLGVNILFFTVILPALKSDTPLEEVTGFVTDIGLYFVLIFMAYTALMYFLGERMVGKSHPWVGTLLFLGPLALIYLFQLGPQSFRVAIGVYISISLIFTSMIKYGGCEVVSIQSLIFGRRYTVYCPLNAIDAVENSLTPSATAERKGILSYISIILVALIGGYFYIIEPTLLHRYGISFELDRRVSLLLLIPVFFFARNSFLTYRKKGKFRLASGYHLLSAGVVLALILTINVAYIQNNFFWLLAMASGGVYAFVLWVQKSIKKPGMDAGKIKKTN